MRDGVPDGELAMLADGGACPAISEGDILRVARRLRERGYLIVRAGEALARLAPRPRLRLEVERLKKRRKLFVDGPS